MGWPVARVATEYETPLTPHTFRHTNWRLRKGVGDTPTGRDSA